MRWSYLTKWPFSPRTFSYYRIRGGNGQSTQEPESLTRGYRDSLINWSFPSSSSILLINIAGSTTRASPLFRSITDPSADTGFVFVDFSKIREFLGMDGSDRVVSTGRASMGRGVVARGDQWALLFGLFGEQRWAVGWNWVGHDRIWLGRQVRRRASSRFEGDFLTPLLWKKNKHMCTWHVLCGGWYYGAVLVIFFKPY